MRKTSIRVMKQLFKGPASIKELAAALGLSYPTVASAVKTLMEEGLCERTNGSIRVRPTPQTQALENVLARYEGEKLLSGLSEKVLTSIIEPATVPQIARNAGLAEQTVYRALRVLKAMLAVSVKDGNYSVGDEELKEFLKLRRAEKVMKRGEAGATVIYSNDIVLKRAPKGLKVKGAPTAFSRFSDFGVDYGAETRDYFVEPATELGAEEVLAHALLASRDALDTTMCAVFYLKNEKRIVAGKARRLAKRLGVLDPWLDLMALCRGLPLKQPQKFLPWDEFTEKAAVYGVKVKAPFRIKKVHELFKKLGTRLERGTGACCFGGVNLMLTGLKEATKDVDLVVDDRRSFETLHQALLGLDYRPLGPRELGRGERRLGASGIYIHESLPRVDLFTRRICGAFELTEGMKLGSRAMRFGRLEVIFLSLEAVFLLKSITEREGDLLDMEAIARHGVDWKLLEQIYWEEEKLVGRRFCLGVLDGLEVIQERSETRIPFLHRLLRHCIEEGVKQSVELGAQTISELKRLLDFPESTLRRAVRRLASRGEVKLVRRGRRVRLKPFDGGAKR